MQCPQDELQLELAYYQENLKRGMGNEEWSVEERNKRSEVIVGKKTWLSWASNNGLKISVFT
jgi:hypothetical protein